MSEMEIAYGWFRPSNEKIEPEDTDDFYDLEKKNNCHYVKVKGQLYAFACYPDELDASGFSLLIPNMDDLRDTQRFICMWYNGGAGIHEVVEDLIEGSLKDAL